MKQLAGQNTHNWTPSVYYAEILVNCTKEKAWKAMLDYQAWNPTFIGAQVTPVCGKPGTEGEVVRIGKQLSDVNGDPLPEFFAETVKVVPERHIVWYVHPKEGDAFCNFVDFGLVEAGGEVKFQVLYYEQNRLSGSVLLRQREQFEATLLAVAAAFKSYCETGARPAGQAH